MRVRVVEHVECLVRLGGELEVGAVPFVRDGDRQLVRGLMPEEHDLDAVAHSVCELSIRLLRRVGACHGGSLRRREPRAPRPPPELLSLGSTIAARHGYVSGASYRIGDC